MHRQNESWHSSDSLPDGVSQYDLDNSLDFNDDFIVQEVAITSPKVTKLDEWRKVPIHKEETGEEKFNRAMDELQMTIDSCIHSIGTNMEVLNFNLTKLVELIKNK